MKKIIFVLAVITLSIGSCKKTDVVPTIKPSIIDLGKHSDSMSYNDIPKLNNGTLSINLNVTPGSKYSVQVTDINGDEVASKGLVADATTELVKLDVSKLTPGFYDITVLDIAGGEIKSPIIIH
jgi:hypothetical protein